MFQQKEVFSDMETSRTYLTGNRSGGRGGGSKGGSSRNLSLYPKGGQEVRQREESRSKSVDFLKETSNRAHSLSPSRSPHRTPFVSHKHVHYIHHVLYLSKIFSFAIMICALHILCESFTCTMIKIRFLSHTIHSLSPSRSTQCTLCVNHIHAQCIRYILCI